LMEGEIICKSEKGIGTEFSFLIPFRYEEDKSRLLIERSIDIFEYKLSPQKTFIDSIKKQGWSYSSIQSLKEISSKENNSVKVLIFPSQKLGDITYSDVVNIDLIGLCHPMGFDYSDEEVSKLSKLNKPYRLLESPIYGSHVNEIYQAIYEQVNGVSEPPNKHNLGDKTALSEIRILLVEDNLVNQLVAKELLYSMGANVAIVENGQLAIDYIEKNTIDVVLMDIQMPIMDGLTATKILRKKTIFENLPIIAMTAHARQEDINESINAGMNLHISKPIKKDILLKSILSVVSEKSSML